MMLEVFSIAGFNNQKDNDGKHKFVYEVKFSRKKSERSGAKC